MRNNDYNGNGVATLRNIDNTYGHIQPQAIEVEKAVLGAQMIDRDAPSLISGIVRPTTYYEPRHQMIQEAIDWLLDNGKPIDVLTVTERLSRMGKLEEVGGPGYIAELSARVASSANIVYHSGILATKSLSRQLIEFGSRINTRGYNETEDPYLLIEEAQNILFEMVIKNTVSTCKPFNENVADTLAAIRAASESPDGITGIRSFRSLDKTIHGWQKGDLVIVAARPSMGKTSFALSLAKIISIDNQIPSGFLSLEMNRIDLTKRLIANLCEVDGSNLQTGRLLSSEWDRIYERGDYLMNAPLFIDDTPGMTLNDIRNNAKRMKREHDVKIIFIDYLQLIHYTGRRFASRQEEVSAISRSLKTLAAELNIPIIALSQLNRSVENRSGLEGKRPLLSDLRESGAIEQDADIVIFVHRPEYYHIYQDDLGNSLVGKAEIIIAKHRKGSTPIVTMTFKGEYSRFDD